LLISLLNVPDWAAEKPRLATAVPGLCLVVGLALACVVGDGLAATGEPLARFAAALRGAGVAIEHLIATPLRLSAAIPAAASADAQRALHAAFVR
jgi:aspartate kinase